jgi:hypothetical protein
MESGIFIPSDDGEVNENTGPEEVASSIDEDMDTGGALTQGMGINVGVGANEKLVFAVETLETAGFISICCDEAASFPNEKGLD